MFFVTHERAHSRNRVQKGSCFIQISAFHACYFCSRVRLLARDISQISMKHDSQQRELQRGPSFPLLSPASARRASNCFILREMRENKWILTRKSHYFWLRAGIISTTFTSKQRNTTMRIRSGRHPLTFEESA